MLSSPIVCHSVPWVVDGETGVATDWVHRCEKFVDLSVMASIASCFS